MATTRVATAGTFNSGDLISAADINSMPGGTIGRDTATSNTAGTTTIETACSVAPTVGASRELTITGCINIRASAATGAQVALYEDSVQIQRRNISVVASATDYGMTLVVLSENPGAGSHTYELTDGVSGAAGATVTCVNNGGSGTLGCTQLIVFDSGPSF